MPVQDYLLTDAQLKLVNAGRLVLLERCLQRFGIRVSMPSPPSLEYGPRSLTDRRYGITDAALAGTAGYGLGDRDPARQTRPQTPDLGADGQTVLTGAGRSRVRGLPVPEKGCLGEADRALDAAAPPASDPALGHTLQFRSFEASRRNDQVRSVLGAWSTCMADAGYDYTDPLEAAGDPRFSPHGHGDEIRVATADIRCKQRTNVIGVWFTVEAAIQTAQIAADRQAFEATRAALAARLRTASDVVRAHR